MGNFDRTWRFDSILKMDTTVWLSVLLAVITFATPALTSEPRVVCYYTNWSVYRPGTARFNPQNINPYLCTHLVYAFGGFTKDNTLKPFDKYQDIEKGGYAKFTGLKTYNRNLKTLLAIGGWNEGSSRFSPMVASRDKRKEFVRNAIKFLRQNRFDGLDLDWEYPAFRDGGKPKDRDNYARLVKELREEFERESQKTGKPRLLLTMAVPAGIEYVEKGFDIKTLNQYLDWMNLLTYDYHSAFEPAVNHHAPLYPLEEANEYSVDSELNIDYTIKYYLENGADRDKLVLGIPTYGRSYTLFNPDAIEIGSPADGPGEQGDATREKGYLAYYEICEALKPKERKRRLASEEYSDEETEDEEEEEPWTVMHPNTKAMGPVAYKGNQWVGYDDIDIVKKKAEYVVENGLGGIMFWSIDNDDFRGNCHGKPYPLIEAAKEAYIQKLGSSDNTVVTDRPASKTSSRRRNRPKSTTSTTPKPPTAAKSNKRKTTSTTPSNDLWNIITPEPPTTPDPGSDFKCTDEGFFPHPRDCKKYFWCLDSGPSNLGIVAHHFTCPSGLFFNKAADSCDFARNVHCKMSTPTTKAPTTKTTVTTTTTTSTTTRKPIKLSTRNSILFRTSTTTTPEPETEEEYEDDLPEDSADIDAEDPRVIKELIDLIKKVGGIEQLEKQLHLSESSVITDSAATNAPALTKKLYEKVLERTRGRNKFGSNSIIQSSSAYSRRGPQSAGLEATEDKDQLLRKDRPQYTTINRQRPSTSSTTQEPLESEETDDEEDEEVKPVLQRSRTQVVESEVPVGTTAKPLQYVNIRRARPTTLATSDTADDSASRNALFERSEQPAYLPVSETPNSLDIASARRENVPEYVTIRRQRPTTQETTTEQYQNTEQELGPQETALEREISAQPQYTSIVRGRSTTTTTPTPEEPSSPEPTTVLAVQISSFLNSPTFTEVESPEPETTAAQTTIASEPTTDSTTTTTTTPAPTTIASSLPTRRTILRRRGSTTTTTTTIATPVVSSSTQAAKRNFLRRTKATAPPDTTESDTVTLENIDTTTNKFTRRGGSKFKNRKDVAKETANNTGRTEKNELENRTRRPYLSGGPRRSERPALTPTRTFARRKPGGANVTTTTPQLSSTIPPPSRRPFRVANRRRLVSSTTSTTTTSTTTTTEATTTAVDSEESLQDIGDTDFIEDPSLEPRTPKISPKIQRRPLISLKEESKDQNPSATNEEERKRQSKKYSASIKQNQLDDLLRLKVKSQEDTTEYKTTVEEYSAETALAIAAHQLLTAPVPSITDFEEETKPSRTQTTQEYKYISPVTDYADSKNTYEYPSSTVYKPSTERNYISTTPNDFDDPTLFNSPKLSTTTYEPTEFDSPKLSTTTNEPTEFDPPKVSTTTYYSTQFNSPNLPTTTFEQTEFDSPKVSTTTYYSTQFNSPNLPTTTYDPTEFNSPKVSTPSYDPTQYDSPRLSPTAFTPKSTYDNDITDTPTGNSRTLTPSFTRSTFNNELTFSTPEYPTVNVYTTLPIEFNNVSPTASLSPLSGVSKDSPFPDYTYDNNYIRTTDYAPRKSSTRYSEPSPFSREPATDYTNIPSDYLPKISPTTNYARNPTSTFKTRTGFSTANIITSGLSAVSKNLGTRYQTSEKYIPVPVEGLEYSTVGYSGSTQEPSSRSQEPSYFTREYLLESPVTKTYDDEYQYLAPLSTPQTPPRRIIRKKIQRKISTTIRPTTTFKPRLTTTYIAPVTTPKPRRVPSKKPFEKILKEDPPRTFRPIVNYDYYDDSEERVAEKYVEGTKVVLHTKGAIECLDIGNFPHPTSCKKFISCARMESGALLGWEYICPKGLSFDPVGSICNWSAGLGCDEKDL